jgi:hypothetical protein
MKIFILLDDDLHPLKTFRSKDITRKLEDLKIDHLERYIGFLANVFSLSSKEQKLLLEIGNRMKLIWSKSGTKFAIQYFSEVVRLIVEFLGEDKVINNKIRVAKYRNNLPKLLGTQGMQIICRMRLALHSNDLSLREYQLGRVLISFLSLSRILCPKHEIKLGSVTDPFSGVCPTLDYREIDEALKSLGLSNLKLKSPRILFSDKAGVSARFAWLSLSTDLIALNSNPSIMWNYLKYSWKLSYYKWLVYIITLSILVLPFTLLNLTLIFFHYQIEKFLIDYLTGITLTRSLSSEAYYRRKNLFHVNYPNIEKILYFLESPFEVVLGRLHVVKELKGKARVIGITDNWTQMLFKPLHDAIYIFLGTIPEDGTKDQLAPIKALLRETGRTNYLNSVDLSNATDRLPVLLQAHILERLSIPGFEWMAILNRPYRYADEEGSPSLLKYSVGQPMGAYSSFAMLALTNHVIMNVAAVRVFGTHEESRIRPGQAFYAILGDDVAILSPTLALEYINIMRYLGVEINPLKGFRGRVLEFAKNYFYVNGVNLSPLSPKVTLRASMNPIFLPALVNDYCNKDFHDILELECDQVFPKIFAKSFKKRSIFAQVKWILSIVGPQSGLHNPFFWGSQARFNLNRALVAFVESSLGQIGVSLLEYREGLISAVIEASLRTVNPYFGFITDMRRLRSFLNFPLVWTSSKFGGRESPFIVGMQYSAAITSATRWFTIMPIILYLSLGALIRNLVIYLLGKFIRTFHPKDGLNHYSLEFILDILRFRKPSEPLGS